MSIDRIAVVDGVRTPFAKQRTAYRDLTALDLGTYAVIELLERTEIDPAEIDQVVFGQVIPSVKAPNVAREIVLASGLPRSIEAYSVSRACATSYQTTVNAAQAILAGAADVVIAGGTDCVSDAPVTVSPAFRDALADAAAAKSATDRVRAFAGLSPRDLLPEAPAIAEYSTGETMGEAAERMAKLNGIGRRAQDAFAHRSHTLAARAWNEGRFAEEVMPVHLPPNYEATLEEDNVVRKDSELEAYEKLRPVFDRAHGTVTAANSSPLTDGAAALLVAREDKARALGLPILGFVRSSAFAALDPAGQLLMGPAYATPIALERAGIAFRDLDLIDMHEAFAAQMLSVLQAFGSKSFAERELGRAQPIGEVDDAKLNVNGGSIAIGHPFAATGARQITQTLRELRRRKGGFALCTACAAGGLGAAMVLEAA